MVLILSLSLELRFETVDLATRLLVPIIVLQNHNRYNLMDKGHNYSINLEAIETEVRYVWRELNSLCFAYYESMQNVLNNGNNSLI